MAKKNHIVLRVEGMTCDGCARHVTEALKSAVGIEEAQVGSWKSGQATVIANETVKDENLVKAVKEAGYHAIVRERKPIEGERKAPPTDGVEYDLMIIGGGAAAFAAAIKASELGSKVAMVESGTIGGTCVNIGCVPSKTLIRAAERCYKCSYQNFQGMAACPPPEDWTKVIQQKDQIVADLREGKYVNVAKSYPNITIIKGTAKLIGKRLLSIDGKTYQPGKILIATGSRLWAPPIPGLHEAGFIDSTAALSLPALPRTMIIIGGGAIGLEFAQLFARFGVKITVLEAFPRIAAAEEPEISKALTTYLQKEKIDIHAGVKIEYVEKKDSEYRVCFEVNEDKQTAAAEQLLVATGRRPHTTHLGLDNAGVQVGKRGEVMVDKHLQTTNPDIYAAGDCIGDPMYVYTAAYAGGLAVENALKNAGRLYDLFALPRVTFTDPQIGSVGLTEAQSHQNGHKVKVSILPLNNVPRAIAARDTRGLIKLVANEETGRLVGAHILGVEAGDVIQEPTLAIRFGLTAQDIVETFHPYLTMVEGIKLAALTFEKDVHQLSCCAA